MLVRIVYASQIAPGCGQAEVDRIVAHAHEANARLGITGVLAFDGVKIIQILEGPSDQVDALYDKISTDRRHQGVVQLSRRFVAVKSFANWSMVRRPIADVYMMAEAA